MEHCSRSGFAVEAPNKLALSHRTIAYKHGITKTTPAVHTYIVGTSMPTPKLNSIDDYELFLSETIENWSQQQRTAFAAAMAERWLPVYESFSAAEDWGDP